MFRRTSGFLGGGSSASSSPLGSSTVRAGLVTSGNVVGNQDPLACLAGLEAGGECLGTGSFGTTHKRKEIATGRYKVVKTVKKIKGWDPERLKREAELLRNLDHPHILRLFGWCEDQSYIYMVLECCEGGELGQTVRRTKASGFVLPEGWAVTVIRQTTEAISYCHTKNLIHKDLKSENILMLNGLSKEDDAKGISIFAAPPHVVIADMGLAEVYGSGGGWFGSKSSSLSGTPSTMAPEVWKGSYSPKADIWSLGCVMFEIFTGRMPFQANSQNPEKWLALHRDGPDWNLMKHSRESVNLCQQLLNVKDRSRPTAKECLRHQWFSKYGMSTAESLGGAKQMEALAESCRNYIDTTPIQKALRLKMATDSNLTSSFGAAFCKFDTDACGTLTQDKLVTALMHLRIDARTAKNCARACDINGDGTCEYVEFAAAGLAALGDMYDELFWVEFRALDIQKKTLLEMKDLDPLLNRVKPIAEVPNLKLADFDNSSYGVINFNEFCAYFGNKNVQMGPEAFLARRSMHEEKPIVEDEPVFNPPPREAKATPRLSSSAPAEVPKVAPKVASRKSVEMSAGPAAAASKASATTRRNTSNSASVKPTSPSGSLPSPTSSSSTKLIAPKSKGKSDSPPPEKKTPRSVSKDNGSASTQNRSASKPSITSSGADVAASPPLPEEPLGFDTELAAPPAALIPFSAAPMLIMATHTEHTPLMGPGS